MKILNEFRDQVKHIRKPVILTGKTNYPVWREEILLAARQSETEDILEEEQMAPAEDASPDMKRFWKERNMWLYNNMWSAIAPQARAHFTVPKESELSAYALWVIPQNNFAERPAVRRTRLYKEMITFKCENKRVGSSLHRATHSNKDRVYPPRIQGG
ncbi:hypothetical protein ACJ73_02114 [Blastomyces percursus]|uniref:DUF4219 domain-containing protein n=1 Tax=Blastomyces percursus TaxID=1658174 RepID=A0A1J9QCD1_9EURO|nr:hypothetical protein ACJ73_02114 [Blastomyces percursus]